MLSRLASPSSVLSLDLFDYAQVYTTFIIPTTLCFRIFSTALVEPFFRKLAVFTYIFFFQIILSSGNEHILSHIMIYLRYFHDEIYVH